MNKGISIENLSNFFQHSEYVIKDMDIFFFWGTAFVPNTRSHTYVTIAVSLHPRYSLLLSCNSVSLTPPFCDFFITPIRSKQIGPYSLRRNISSHSYPHFYFCDSGIVG